MTTAERPPRLVATDLDGTLLRTDGTVSARTRAALAAAERWGISVVFVTARPPRWLHELAEVVGGHGLAICANGAILYDVSRRHVISVTPLTEGSVIAVVEALRRELPGTTFATEHASGFAQEAAFPERLPHPETIVTGPIETLLDELPAKLLARNDELSPTDFVARGGEVLSGLAGVHVSGATGLLEISALGVSKAAALATWCERNEIDASDVWAFGDMLNDLPMLAWAGRSFGVANAHRDVLAAVTDVIASNDDDGVARMLEVAMAMSAGSLAE